MELHIKSSNYTHSICPFSFTHTQCKTDVDMIIYCEAVTAVQE